MSIPAVCIYANFLFIGSISLKSHASQPALLLSLQLKFLLNTSKKTLNDSDISYWSAGTEMNLKAFNFTTRYIFGEFILDKELNSRTIISEI
jgi:hypothetical protein